jgi:predicted permease
MLRDLRLAFRALAQAPGFSLVAVATLALGLGATTALFSVVNASLLQPLPFPEPDRLAALYEISPEPARARNEAGAATFLEWRQKARGFSHLAAFTTLDYALTGGGEPESILAARVSAEAFALLGVAPVLGRAFVGEEEAEGRHRVVVLSHELWAGRFGADPAVLGRAIHLDGEPYTVVGVMPRGFRFPDARSRLWTPLAFTRDELVQRHRRMFDVVGRLAPGVSLASAQAEMSAIARGLAAAQPDTQGWDASVLPVREVVSGGRERPLLVLLGAVACVLLVACANVGSLLLARAAGRRRELAIHTALGAGRTRLLRGLFAEAALLALLGGVMGVALASWSFDLLLALLPADWPRLQDPRLDGSVLAFALGATVLTALVAGLAPAVHLTLADLGAALREGGRTPGSTPARPRLRQALVVGQVAASLVLMAGAGLLAQTLWRLQRVDPGFNPHGLLAAAIYLPDTRYPDDPRQVAFFADLLERARRLPGVLSAGAVTTLPLSPMGIDHDMPFSVDGQAAPPAEEADFRIASPGYFRTLGTPLLSGREFGERDDAAAPAVAIVNRTFAERFLAGEPPLGRRVRLGQRGRPYEVVGVVGEVRHRSLDRAPRPELYVSYRQMQYGSMTVLLRTAGDPSALAAPLKREVLALDPGQPLTSLSTMDALLSDSLSARRFQALLLGSFAATALGLSALGLYGLLAHTVRQRTPEIGVRMALGARPADVVRLVVRGGLGLAALGVALGLAGALAATRVLDGLLFQVPTRDPVTLAASGTLLLAIALLACALPARRASRIDPARALRCE